MKQNLHTYDNGVTLNMVKQDGTPYKTSKYNGVNIHEPIETKIFGDILDNNEIKNYFNVGAFLGYYSILCKLISPSTDVVCFEGEKWLEDRIKESIELNNVDGIDIEIGYVGKDYKLSRKISKYESIDLMNMDIQGDEVIVLEDLVGTKEIEKVKRILIGTHQNKNMTSTHPKCLKILENNGFEIKFDGKPWQVKNQPDGLIWGEKIN